MQQTFFTVRAPKGARVLDFLFQLVYDRLKNQSREKGKTMLTGSIVALPTPFKEDGSVNYEQLGKWIEFQIANGTDGVLVLVRPASRRRRCMKRTPRSASMSLIRSTAASRSSRAAAPTVPRRS